MAAPDVMGDFDAWARVASKLMKRSAEERQRILEGLELTAIWPDADEKWSTALTDSIVAKDMTLANRYGAICADEVKRRPLEEAHTHVPVLIPSVAASPTPTQSAMSPVAITIEDGRTLASSPRPPSAATPFRGHAVTPMVHNPHDVSLPPGESGTAALSTGLLAQQTGAANRFDAASGMPNLTVQQYAKLCARLVEQPRFAGVIYADYGVTSQSVYAALDAHWRAKLANEPESKRLFDMLYPYLRTQLRAGASS